MAQPLTTYERAVRFAMSVIRQSRDWQEVQHALFNDDTFGPWLRGRMTDEDDGAEMMSIIHQAEERLGDDIPGDYA
jgi:hypothetical protein